MIANDAILEQFMQVTSLQFQPLLNDPEFAEIANAVKSIGFSLDALFSWTALWMSFSERIDEAAKLNERISKWNPDHPDTTRFKKCWNRVYFFLQHPETNQLDAVVADMHRLNMIVRVHSSIFVPAAVAISVSAAIATPLPAAPAMAPAAIAAVPITIAVDAAGPAIARPNNYAAPIVDSYVRRVGRWVLSWF
jgi:hypothetical protein